MSTYKKRCFISIRFYQWFPRERFDKRALRASNTTWHKACSHAAWTAQQQQHQLISFRAVASKGETASIRPLLLRWLPPLSQSESPSLRREALYIDPPESNKKQQQHNTGDNKRHGAMLLFIVSRVSFFSLLLSLLLRLCLTAPPGIVEPLSQYIFCAF